MQRAMSPQGGMQHNNNNNNNQGNMAGGNQQQIPPSFNQENMHGNVQGSAAGGMSRRGSFKGMDTSGFSGANMNDANMTQMMQRMNAAANMEGSGGGGMTNGNQGFSQSFGTAQNNMAGNMPNTEGSSGRTPLANMANGNQGQGFQGEGTQHGAANVDPPP